MPILSALGAESAVLGRIAYPIFRPPQPVIGIGIDFNHRKASSRYPRLDQVAVLGLQGNASRPVSFPKAGGARGGSTDPVGQNILDIQIHAPPHTLKSALFNLENGLLVELHRALGSENFHIKPSLAPLPQAADDQGAEYFVLTYTTPLSFAAMKAHNTENISVKPSGPTSFYISSCCSTAGVPVGNCFVNRLEWNIEANGSNTCRIVISACTDFIVPVVGLLRGRIESESIKGIKDSYSKFAAIVKQRFPDSAGAFAPSNTSSPAHMVSNRTDAAALSAPIDPGASNSEQNIENSSPAGSVAIVISPSDEGSVTEIADVEDVDEVLDEDISEEQLNEEGVVEGTSTAAANLYEEEPLARSISKPKHRPAFNKYHKLEILDKMMEQISADYPEWAKNRYWLLTSGHHGGIKEIYNAPSPDDALGMLWALAATAGRKRGNSAWKEVFVKDALIKGLIECLRVVPPRTPHVMSFKPKYKVLPPTKKVQGKASGTDNINRSQNSSSRTAASKRTGNSIVSDDVTCEQSGSTVTQSHAMTHSLLMPQGPAQLSPCCIGASIFVLGWISGDQWYKDEMEALCHRIPEAEFCDVKDVYRVLWSLRGCRHWTQHLDVLENAAVDILSDRDLTILSSRPVRHASFVYQALVNFGHSPKKLSEVLMPLVEKYWDWRGATSVAWGVAIGHDLRASNVQMLLRGLEANAEDGLSHGFPRRAFLGKFWQMSISLDKFYPGFDAAKESWGPAMRELMSRCERAWNQEIGSRPKVISQAQKDVYLTMQSMGYTAELESIVCELSVDVAVPGMKLVVEVDGPVHFARNRPDLTIGNSLWKKRLLQSHGWVVMNVNVTVWMMKRGAGERRGFLKRLIETESLKQKEAAGAKTRRPQKKGKSFASSKISGNAGAGSSKTLKAGKRGKSFQKAKQTNRNRTAASKSSSGLPTA